MALLETEEDIDISNVLAKDYIGTKPDGNHLVDGLDFLETAPPHVSALGRKSRTDEAKSKPSKSKPNADPKDTHGRRIEEESDDSEGGDMIYRAPKAKKKVSKGTFAGLGLSSSTCKAVLRKGYKMPTPIQRKTIPLILDGRDIVGMARTGSGKTAAFILPLIDKLKAHSAKSGARALLLSPNRELALQTLKVVRDFSKGTDLKSVLLVGGDSMEDQFGFIMGNPDIIVATPGRFLHLKIEMGLSLMSLEYVVFDEADRLFEMGFSEQLESILAALPETRQTMLFSATLPKSLVDFAKAGLQEPTLIRLDAEQKISSDLQMAFFKVKSTEREASLFYILDSIIGMPTENQLSNNNDKPDESSESKKRKRNNKPKKSAADVPSPFSTIVFTPTKHHVEYLATLLKEAGYAVSYIYGSLDQHARKQMLADFRSAKTTIMVVTDVAARGIDIPILANVINYALPASAKVFIHRVGRTARAGQRGWAYSIFKETELAYLLDLEIFLSKKIRLPNSTSDRNQLDFTNNMYIGGLPKDDIETYEEQVKGVISRDSNLPALEGVAERGEKLYEKSKQLASQESVKRGKQLVQDSNWNGLHPLFQFKVSETIDTQLDPKEHDRQKRQQELEMQRQDLLRRISNFAPQETVFEVGKRGPRSELVQLMERRRQQVAPVQKKAEEKKQEAVSEAPKEEQEVAPLTNESEIRLVDASEADLEAVFKQEDSFLDEDKTRRKKKSKRSKQPESFKDPQFYMSHYAPASMQEEQGYRVQDSVGQPNFVQASTQASFDLAQDETNSRMRIGMAWDKKRGKFVNAGSQDNKKYIRGEDGRKIAATFKSGRFDAWNAKRKGGSAAISNSNEIPISVQPGQSHFANSETRGRFKHTKAAAPKEADKFRDNYHVQKKRRKEAEEKGIAFSRGAGGKQAKNELQTTEQVRKARLVKENRRAKNARPSKKRR